MNPRVKQAQAHDDYSITLLFDDGETGIFSVIPFLEYPAFRPLKDLQLFRTASAAMGFVTWQGKIDIDPDTLYLDSIKVGV